MSAPRGLTAAGFATVLAGLAALAAAYYAQFVLLLAPCPLCLLERWPYRVAIALGVAALIVRARWARHALMLAVLAFLATSAVAGVHVGVELGWWKSPLPECNAFMPGGMLLARPAVPCDRPVYFAPWMPFSIATLDFFYSLFCAAVLATWLRRMRRGA